MTKKHVSSYDDIDAILDGVATPVPEPEPNPLHTWEPSPLLPVLQRVESKPLPALHEQDLALVPGGLSHEANAELRKYLQSKGTNPSPEEWHGLEQNTLAIEGMADRTLPAKFYLSGLAPGVGKTSGVCCTIRAMIGLEKYKNVSAVIFVFRCEEIERLKKDMNLKDEDFAVLVSEKGEYAYMNQWGNQDPTKARVLFTTQQRLQMECNEGTKFADIAPFQYKGKAREVRVWDEAIVPSLSLTVTSNQIARLFLGAAARDKEIEAYLKTLCRLIDSLQEGVVADPIIRDRVDLDTFISWYHHSDDQAVAEALYKLSGAPNRIASDNSRNTMLQYEELFPDDFAPLLILDASGLQRETYAQWFKGRGGLHLLPSPAKDYSPFSIHHWDRGAGRGRHIKWHDIADGVAAAIKTLPDDPILVVHFKDVKMEAFIKQRLGHDPRVQFCTWGQHTATNDYKDCKHVILAGVLQYSTAAYEAIARGAKRMSVFDLMPDDELRKTRLGEIKHNILQAACRGAVRKSEGNKCPEGCTLHIIYSTHKAHGLPREILTEVFKNATVHDWLPLGEKPRAQPERPTKQVALNRVIKTLAGMEGDVTVPELQKKAGVRDRSQLNKMTHSQPFQAALKLMGRVRSDGDRTKPTTFLVRR